MHQEELHEWRLAEKAAVEAEAAVRSNIGRRNPMLRELKIKAVRLRAEADSLLAKAAQLSSKTRLPEHGEPASLSMFIAAWQRAEKRSEAAEARLIAAFARYVEQGGPLPPMQFETDVAMLRLETINCLEQIYAEAKRLRSPSTEDFRSSVPGSMGGHGT